MILAVILEFGSANRKDSDDLLMDERSDVLTDKQKRYRVGNIIMGMARRDKTIRNQGSDRKPQWVLIGK